MEGRSYTILFIPWVEEWGHETSTVLNRSKVHNPCLCWQLSITTGILAVLHWTAEHMPPLTSPYACPFGFPHC